MSKNISVILSALLSCVATSAQAANGQTIPRYPQSLCSGSFCVSAEIQGTQVNAIDVKYTGSMGNPDGSTSGLQISIDLAGNGDVSAPLVYTSAGGYSARFSTSSGLYPGSKDVYGTLEICAKSAQGQYDCGPGADSVSFPRPNDFFVTADPEFTGPIPLNPSSERTILSCQNGAALVATLEETGLPSYTEVLVEDPAAALKLGSYLGNLAALMQGLDSNHYIGSPYNTGVSSSDFPRTGGLRFMQEEPSLNPSEAAFSSIVQDSSISTITFNPRAENQADVGKVSVNPGYYAFLDENRALTIRIFRTENKELGVPGLFLGEVTFPDCK